MRTKKTVFAVILIILIGLLASGYMFLPKLLLEVRNNLLSEIQPLLNAEFKVDKIEIAGINKISLKNLVINKDNKEIVAVPKTTLTIAFSNIFAENKLKAIDKIEVEQAVINLQVDDQQKWNIQDLLKPSKPSANKLVSLVIVKQGAVNIEFPEQMLRTTLEGSIDARGSDNYNLDLQLALQEIGNLKITGLLDNKGVGKVEFNSETLLVAPLEKLLEKYLAVKQAKGAVNNLNLIYQNTGKEKLLSGKLLAANLAGVKNIQEQNLTFNLQGWLKLTDNKLKFLETILTVNQEPVVLTGEMFLENGLNFKALKLESSGINLEKLIPTLPVQGKVQGRVQLDGNIENLAAEGTIVAPKLTWGEYQLGNVKLPFSMVQQKLFVRQAEMQWAAGEFKIDAEYSFQDHKINIVAAARDVDLQQLPGATGLSGLVKLDLVAAGYLTVEKINLTGNLKLGEFKYRGLRLNEANLDFTKQNEAWQFYNTQATLGDSGKLVGSGNIIGDALDIQVQAQNLPLAEIGKALGVEAKGAINSRAKIQGTISQPLVQVALNTGKINLAGQNIDSIVGSGEYQAGKFKNLDLLVVTSKIMNLPQGKHRLQGTIDIAGAVPEFNLSLLTSGARIDELATAFLPIKLTGFFNNELQLNGKLNNPQLKGKFRLYEGSANGFLLDNLQGFYNYKNQELVLTDVEVSSLQATAHMAGKMAANGNLDFILQARKINLSHLPISKEYTPKGYADFSGRVTGNLRQPIFKGAIQAEKISLLNQEFTDFVGNLNSEVGLKTEVDVNFKQGQGRFDFYGGIDLTQAYVYGKLGVENADVKSLLALGKADFEAAGLLNGEINLNRRGKGTGIEIQGQVKAGSLKKIPLQDIKVDIVLDKKKIVVNKFEALQGQQGKLVILGSAEYNGEINLELSAQNLNAQLLTALSKESLDLTGNLELLAQVSGQTRQPDISASGQISNGALNKVAFDNLYALVNIEKLQQLNIQQLFIQKQGYKASAYGYIPLDVFRSYEERKNKNAAMDILFKLDNANLGILTSLTRHIPYATGEILGDLRVTGDFKNPQLQGNIKTKEAMLKLDIFKKPLTNLNLDVEFSGTKVKLNDFSAKMGEGNLVAMGDLNLAGQAVDNYQLDVKLNKLAIDSLYTTGPLTANLQLKPQEKRSRPYIKGEVLLDDLLINIPAIPEFGEGELPNVGLDIAINMGKNLKLYNPILYDMDLEGGLKILGSLRRPNIDGTIRVKRGTINYLRTPFKVKYAVLGFPLQGSLMPSINLAASSRLFSTDIFLNVRGPVNEMDMKLTSNPPLTQQELFRMLTLRTQVTNTTAVEGEDAKALLSAGLQMSIFGELESAVRDTLGIDEFRLYQGELLNGTTFGNGSKKFEAKKDDYESYNVLVSKYITDKILLGYTTTLDREHYNYYMQYELDKRLNFNVGWDESKKYRYGVEYKINF